MTALKICSRCVMDETDPEIKFDEKGYCSHCLKVEQELRKEPYCFTKEEKNRRLELMVEKIKSEGSGKKYDCIIGFSGGVDSTYVAYMAIKLGLRPLMVHVDNGWDMKLATENVENACKKLNLSLYDHVLDWDEFRDLQVSFLKSSTTDLEIITDHAIKAVLFRTAAKEGIRYILLGTNMATESIFPERWSTGHWDWKYIESVHKQFGSVKLKSFPHLTKLDFRYFKKVKKIIEIALLDYLDYSKDRAKKILAKELNWQDYGSKHMESLITKFHMNYILPTKFGYEKRKAHLSSLIMSGQMTREQALDELKKPLYDPIELKKDKEYVLKKLNVTSKEFDAIMALPPKTFWDYPSYSKS